MRSSTEQSVHASQWDAEVERYEFNQDDLDTIDAVDLPDELALHKFMADNDQKFADHWCDWEDFIYQNWLFLALEQSCHEGILLPSDQRAIRLKSCPEATLSKLRWFFEFCPAHVKSHLALRWYWLMRIDRARRTGAPDWHRGRDVGGQIATKSFIESKQHG